MIKEKSNINDINRIPRWVDEVIRNRLNIRSNKFETWQNKILDNEYLRVNNQPTG